MNKNNYLLIKILATLAYLAMVAVNFLANALPINNRSTGQISDDYQNLFAPAGITFSIWGLIYLLLASYLVYQFVSFGKNSALKNESLLNKINILFIGTSLANISWIFAWHYDFIAISVVIMVLLLVLLIKIADINRSEKLSKEESLFITVPFSVYFGWITVATIANITVFLVSINWNGFGIADSILTAVILLVGAAIGITRMCKDQNMAYGLVLVWAYSGILLKHLSQAGFAGSYPGIIITTIICIVAFIAFLIKMYIKRERRIS